jgi:hypothetical protein
MFCTQSTPDFSVAEHYGLRNTMCLYSKDVASGSHSGLLRGSLETPVDLFILPVSYHIPQKL